MAVNEDCGSQNELLNTVYSDTISDTSFHTDYFANTLEAGDTPYSSELGGGVSCGSYAHFSRGLRANAVDQSASSTTYLNSASFVNSASTLNDNILSDFIHDDIVATSLANQYNPQNPHINSTSNMFARETTYEATPFADLSANNTGVNAYSCGECPIQHVVYDNDYNGVENNLEASHLNASQSTEEVDILNSKVLRDKHAVIIVERLDRYHSGVDMSAGFNPTLNTTTDSTPSSVAPIVPTTPYNNYTVVNATVVNPIIPIPSYPPPCYTYPMPTLAYPIPGVVNMFTAHLSGQTTVPPPSGPSVNYSNESSAQVRVQSSNNVDSCQSATTQQTYFHNFYPTLGSGAIDYVSPMPSMYPPCMFPNGGADVKPPPPLVRNTGTTSSGVDVVHVVVADASKYIKIEQQVPSTSATVVEQERPTEQIRDVKPIKRRRLSKPEVTCPTLNEGTENPADVKKESNVDHGAMSMFRGVTYYPPPQIDGNPHLFESALSRNPGVTDNNNKRKAYRGF